MTAPTLMMLPHRLGFPVFCLCGEGIMTVALSVITSTSGSSSFILAELHMHLTISFHNTFADIGHPDSNAISFL
jgi:hypothetical protein